MRTEYLCQPETSNKNYFSGGRVEPCGRDRMVHEEGCEEGRGQDFNQVRLASEGSKSSLCSHFPFLLPILFSHSLPRGVCLFIIFFTFLNALILCTITSIIIATIKLAQIYSRNRFLQPPRGGVGGEVRDIIGPLERTFLGLNERKQLAQGQPTEKWAS